MVLRAAGVVAALVIGLPVGQASAQYVYPPHARAVLPPDDGSVYFDDDDAPVARPYRYSRDRYDDYARRPYARRYVRVLPDDDSDYEEITPARRRPYFVAPDPRPAAAGSVRSDPRGVEPPAAAAVRPGEPPAPRPPGAIESQPANVASLPPDDQSKSGAATEMPPQFQRQTVDYPTKQPPGTIVIDTNHTYLYLVLGHGQALRYGIGVGREGFTWSGTEKISRMAEWPDWTPPDQMIDRQPFLPRFMAGGPGNPLGARALYLGNTLYRIHGTNDPSTIGQYVSSGCIRLTDTDVEDLYSRVHIGTRVVVLPGKPPAAGSEAHASAR